MLCVATSEFQFGSSCSRFHNSLHSQHSFGTGDEDDDCDDDDDFDDDEGDDDKSDDNDGGR